MIEMLVSAASQSGDDLFERIQEAWQGLADYVFMPIGVFSAFQHFLNNPLCIAITSALLVVAGFVLFARAISIFNIKH